MARLRGFGDRAVEKMRILLLDDEVRGENAARALRSLSYLAQHNVERKLANLALAMKLVERGDQETRSVAVHALVHGFSVLNRMLSVGGVESIRTGMPSWSEVRNALIKALELGLNEEQSVLAKEVLRTSPK